MHISNEYPSKNSTHNVRVTLVLDSENTNTEELTSCGTEGDVGARVVVHSGL